jgi:hypothetical protein
MITKEDILFTVADKTNTEPEKIMQPFCIRGAKKGNICWARQLCMYFAKEYKLGTLDAIGQFYGERDHATVIHADKIVKNDISLYAGKVDTFRRIADELAIINDMKVKRVSYIESNFDYPSEEVSVENLKYQTQ